MGGLVALTIAVGVPTFLWMLTHPAPRRDGDDLTAIGKHRWPL